MDNEVLSNIIEGGLIMMISSEFTCKCGQQKGWVTEGKTTLPCPNCGRKYKGVYSKKHFSIEAIETREDS